MQDFPSQHISTLSLKNKTQLGTLKVRQSFQVWKGDKTVFIGRYWIQVDTRGHWSGSKVGSPAAAGKAPSAVRLVFHPDARRPAGRVRNPRRVGTVHHIQNERLWFVLGRGNAERRVSAELSHSEQQRNNTTNHREQNIVLPHRGNSGFATS